MLYIKRVLWFAGCMFLGSLACAVLFFLSPLCASGWFGRVTGAWPDKIAMWLVARADKMSLRG